MCRLLGLLTEHDAPFAQSLGEILDQFTALSQLHKDGWGIASWGPEGLDVRKEATQATDGGFGEAMRSTVSDAAIAHLRMATPGLAVCRGNTHPFMRDGAAFAHNGSLEPVDRVWDLVAPDLRSDTEGNTDSEAYFRAVLTRMRQDPPEVALPAVAQQLRARVQITGLNALLLTADALYAYSDHDPTSPVTFHRGSDYFPLRYRQLPGSVVVSSTGYEQDPAHWATLPPQHLLKITRRVLEVTVLPSPQ